ncbi:MAG: hypothetical protein JW945_02805 [Methanomicrobia archaeon]|nr:hypothetical protein [Methanomicrobia archaeon]
MVEEISKILSNGFSTWKANLTICLPFVFSFLAISIVALVIIGSALVIAIGPFIPALLPYLTDSGELPSEILQQLSTPLMASAGVLLGAVLVTVILMLLINSFFSAGAIGMASVATKTGHTSLSDMLDYGRRKFLSLLGVSVLIALIQLAGLVFLIPGLISFASSSEIAGNPFDLSNIAAWALFGIGLLLLILYMLIISIVLAIPPYAVVISDLRAIEGIKTGFRFFMEHKLDVFLLWLIVLVIAVLASMVLGSIPSIGGLLSMVVSVVLIQPLGVIWWTRFYLSRAKSEHPVSAVPV